MTISYPYIIKLIYELRSASVCLMKDMEIEVRDYQSSEGWYCGVLSDEAMQTDNLMTTF